MIAAVVLAAGASQRLGRPKQLVEIDGSSLLRRAVEACAQAGCSPVIAVVGADPERMRRELRDTVARVVVNTDWREGMAGSIRVGVAAASQGSQAVLLTVCDQPRLNAELLERLLEQFDGAPGRRVACAYAGTIGTPALFERACFPELLRLRGDRGAKLLLERAGPLLRTVDWPEGAFDVDRSADLGS